MAAVGWRWRPRWLPRSAGARRRRRAAAYGWDCARSSADCGSGSSRTRFCRSGSSPSRRGRPSRCRQARRGRVARQPARRSAIANSNPVSTACRTEARISKTLLDYRLDCFGSAQAGTRGYLMAADTQVLVVSAGPLGLFMAAELNRHGVSCRIVDKTDGPTHDSRAASIQARTLEILESVSLADEFAQMGNICHAAATYNSDHKLIKYLTFDELDSAFPFVLQLPQSQTERMLAR